MENNNEAKYIIDAINILVENKIKKLSTMTYDGRITQASGGNYKVLINGIEYPNIKTMYGVSTFNVGDIVKVLVVQNNFSNMCIYEK